jgi:hypothetical protein
VDQPYTFTVFVKNDSVDQRVDLVDLLPTSASLVSATPSQGSCDLLRHGSGGGQDAVECTLGLIPSGSMAEVEIVVTPRAPGSHDQYCERHARDLTRNRREFFLG